MTSYPLAKNGVFRTIQGEGALLGVAMTFVRLAGCSVGCPLCDTDYGVSRRATVQEIVEEVTNLSPHGWVWITGGEPTDHDLGSLVTGLRKYQVALATAGHRRVPSSWRIDWLSVSPHNPEAWVHKYGSELKIVPGLAGHGIKDFDVSLCRFDHYFVSPCDGKPETVAECVAWVEGNPSWKMTPQAHKAWGLA